MAIMDTNTLITIGVTNVIAGVFIGMGVSVGIYLVFKNNMPKWIHEISLELRKIKTIEKATERRVT